MILILTEIGELQNMKTSTKYLIKAYFIEVYIAHFLVIFLSTEVARS